MRHLAWLGLLFTACSAPVTTRQFEVEQLIMPRSFDDYRLDHRDNQLAAVLSVLIGHGIDPQEFVDLAALRPAVSLSSDCTATFGDGTFSGELHDGFYQSLDGRASLSLSLPFFGGAPVMVRHAILQMEVSDDAVTGQLNAAVPPSEIDSKIMPGVALLMNAKIDGDPDSDFSHWLLELFDVDKDRHIDVGEVATNGVIKQMFKPDVDGWSLGVGFRATRR